MPSFLSRAAVALLLGSALVGPAAAQTSTPYGQMIQGLQAVTSDAPVIDLQALRNWAQSVAAQGSVTVTQPQVVQKLFSLAQITVQIQFALNSAIIRPESYETIGAIADALHDPILWNYRFVVVGNTDASGPAAYNLTLSQQRAEAVAEALANLYQVNPARLEALGLGTAALQDPQQPDNPINRRVQIFNIGLMGPMPGGK
ncbi:OmpA family protein [Chelatococcus asaccharovorans]|uniref:OmpA family protein n=1 Tax=Chelatococcus asaccharovorans TaxID=28210 RepID=UPI00224C73FB|nr:OmpA family protein [Chelatococcus asaccharovorans]CAH1660903.1 Flagellar motor protein MotB [Chelatococcus asaccharovorans]CAH1690167.1 Flagellar motor protein MotB [Chelatococcus asaccharovorans]